MRSSYTDFQLQYSDCFFPSHPCPYLTLDPQTHLSVFPKEAIASAIAENPTLRSLNLNDNYVGEEGALALAEAIAKNTAIQELQLKGNEMGDKGVKALCDVMKVGTGVGTAGAGGTC